LDEYLEAELSVSSAEQSLITLFKKRKDEEEFGFQGINEVEESKTLAAAIRLYHDYMDNRERITDDLTDSYRKTLSCRGI
jgi:hypothetical protein